METEEQVDLVKHPDSMDAPTFGLHMTHRHNDALAGQTELTFKRESDVSQAYRAFHRRLHDLRVDLLHEHGEYRADD
jgi:hypothetical protein